MAARAPNPPNPRPRLRRLVTAFVLALVAATGFGAALAAASGEGSGTTALPATLTVPAARIGDRGAYDATLDGEWRYDGRKPQEAFPLQAFEWVGQEPLRDAEGSLRASDVLRTEGTAYTPWNVVFNEETFEPESGPAWTPGNFTHWFAPAATQLLATGQREAANGTAPSALTLPMALPGGSDQVIVDNGAFDSNGTMQMFPSQPLTVCLLGEAFQGTTVDLGSDLELAACEFPALQYYRENATVRAAAIETVHGVDTVRFEGGNLTFWLASGIPYPIRYQDRSVHLVSAALESDWVTGEGGFTLELTAFDAGSAPRKPDAEPGAPAGPLATSPRQAWGPDESGVEAPFLLSEAFHVAQNESSAVASLLDQSPDAYVDFAFSFGYELGSETHNDWFFSVTDGYRWILLDVEKSTKPGAAGNELPPILVVDGWPQELMVTSYEVTELADTEASEGYVPRPDQLPAEFPTVAAAMERWSLYAGPAYADAAGNSWGFQVFCPGSCEEPVVLMAAGFMESDYQVPDVDPMDDSPVSLYDFRFRVSSIMMEATGHAWYFYELRAGAESEPAVGPVPGNDYSSEVKPIEPAGSFHVLAATLLPTTGQAASAGLVGILAGVAYFAWPLLKGTPILGLFSRLERPRLLGHPARARIVEEVEAEPGIHFKELARRTALPNGTLVHHLQKLVAAGILVNRSAGGYTCYFPKGTGSAAQHAAPALRSGGARRILEAVRGRPGMSMQEVAVESGMQGSTVTYHVQRLSAAGLVEATRDGRSVRLRALQDAGAALPA